MNFDSSGDILITKYVICSDLKSVHLLLYFLYVGVDVGCLLVTGQRSVM